MKKYFAQLRPLERRLAVAVLVALFLVLNYVFIWPHFSDWSHLRYNLADAQRKHIDIHAKQADGYTPLQEFFIGFGQDWCGDTRPAQLRLQVQTDPHSPRQFRVNGVVQNMREFGEAFGCKEGQPMMPVNACRVW